MLFNTNKLKIMLYKNDELYTLSNNDISQMRNTFKKFPVRITYPEGRIVKSRSKHNKLPDKPTSISFPLMGVVKSTKGTEIWRYAENQVTTPNGKKKYLPVNFSFSGIQLLQDTDIELIWFLQTKSPYVKDGLNYNGKTPKAMFEDLIGKAELKAKRQEEYATVQAMIFSSKVGLTEAQLRKVAKAYFINGVDNLTLAQVRIAVDIEVQKDKINGMKKFMDMVAGEKIMDIRELIQNAIDKELIRYHVKTHQWVWVDPTKRKMEKIVQIAPAKDPHEGLLDYYFGDRVFAQNLNSVLRGENIVTENNNEDGDEGGDDDQ